MIRIANPEWVRDLVNAERTYPAADDRVGLAVELARENVLRGTGGPFGAAVFESESGLLVGVGVNQVVPQRNSALHAEVVACMMAQARRRSFTLNAPELPAHELASSCEPCAMCLGAALWSGVRRIVWGASREDAREIGFEEGPVFAESHEYLAARGIELVGGVGRDEARSVLGLYAERDGVIYNG